MKRKLVFIFLIFLVCLIALFIFSLFTADVLGQSDGERKLSKIPPHPMFNRLECGEYFILVSDDQERLRIGFIFEIEPTALEEQAFLPEEFFIVTDNKKTVPTIRFTKQGKVKVILRISKDSLKKSPCLQKCLDANRI